MPNLCTLWVGGPLSKLAYACLSSSIRVGHIVHLYTYDPVPNVPPGVDLRNAHDILPKDRLLKFRSTGSFALGSDLFRYELLRQKAGCWIDTDLFFLKPIDFNSSCIFGWEDKESINSAVLFLAHDSPLLLDLLTFAYSNPVIPPWWSFEKKIVQKCLSYENKALPLEHLEWGVIGPKAVTYYAFRHNLTYLAKPTEVFYPIHWKETRRLFDPKFNIDSRITKNTCAVHLWNNLIQKFKNQEPLPGSFMSRVYSGDGGCGN